MDEDAICPRKSQIQHKHLFGLPIKNKSSGYFDGATASNGVKITVKAYFLTYISLFLR
ncbi:MAG: hypothetical protein VW378_07900 [bacterium]